ncbi:MAG: hypothetical protein QM784_34490 [Polyangiaceae bacterium]
MSFSLRSRGIVALLWLGTEAFAQPSSRASGVQLSWVRGEGAQGCPSTLALQAEVTERLGYSPFTGSPSQWIEGYAVVESGRYLVRIFERDASGKALGTRTLSSELGDCSELGDATSLALALIVDPNAPLKPLPPSTEAKTAVVSNEGGPHTVPESSGKGTGASATASELVATATDPGLTGSRQANSCPESVRHAREPSSRRPANDGNCGDGEASISTQSDVASRGVSCDEPTNATGIALLSGWRLGTFPSPAFGVEFAAEGPMVRILALRYRLGMLFLPEQVVAHDAAKLGYTLTAGHLSACVQIHDSEALRLSGCAGAELGAVNTVVYDPEPTQPGDRPWFATRGDVAVQLRLWGPLRLEARALVLVPVTRWTFRARNR